MSNDVGVMNFTDRDATSHSGLTRRNALAGASVIAATGALSACGGGNNTGAAAKVDIKVPIAKVPVGSGYVDAKNSVVVAQPTKGVFKAFSSVCTHRGCQVSPPQGDTITCHCHGSQFNSSTGDVTAGPAETALAAKTVKVEGDQLHITG